MTTNEQHIDRGALRKLADAATPGPWELIGGGEYVSGPGILVAPDDGGVTSADAEFIAAARTAVSALLDQIDQAEARIKAVRDVLDRWMTYCQTEQTTRALSEIQDALRKP